MAQPVKSGVEKFREMIIEYMRMDYALPPDPKELRQLCRDITCEQRVTLIRQLTVHRVRESCQLEMKNDQVDTLTCLHLAAVQSHYEMVLVLLENLPPKCAVEELTKLVYSGEQPCNLLFLICSTENLDLFRRLVPQPHHADIWGKVLLVSCLTPAIMERFFDGELLDYLLDKIPLQNKFSFLMDALPVSNSLQCHLCTHAAALEGNTHAMAKLLSGLTREEKATILQITDNEKNTALHFAIRNENYMVIDEMLRDLPLEDVSHLLQQKDQDKLTAVQYAAIDGSMLLLRSLRLEEFADKSDLEVLLLFPRYTGCENALDLAQKSGNTLALRHFKEILQKHKIEVKGLQDELCSSEEDASEEDLDDHDEYIQNDPQPYNVKSPEQAVVRLQELEVSTRDQIDKLFNEKAGLERKIQEIARQQNEKQQQNQNQAQDIDMRISQLTRNISQNTSMISELTNQITELKNKVTTLETQGLIINTTLTAQTEHQEYLTTRVDANAEHQADLAASQVNLSGSVTELSGSVDELRRQQFNHEQESLDNESQLRDVASHVAKCKKRKLDEEYPKHVNENRPSSSGS